MEFKEISHEELNKNKNDFFSARYKKIGHKKQTIKGEIKLIDKIIFPINLCPRCGSRATFHQRIQKNNDIVGNVWKVKRTESFKGIVFIKFDYCLKCHREFLIEIYIWEKQ